MKKRRRKIRTEQKGREKEGMRKEVEEEEEEEQVLGEGMRAMKSDK